MKPSVWHGLDALSRQIAPFAVTLLLLLIGLVPTRLPEFARIAPPLTLIAVYHWTIYRPGLMPAPVVFGLGVLQDLLTDVPLGLNPLLLLAAHGIVLSQRRFLVGKTFAVTWLGFAVIAAGAAFAGWLVVSLFHLVVLEPRAFVVQYLVAIGLFPPIGWLLLRLQRILLGTA